MKTYSAIKAEIAKLERKAQEVRRTEVAGVVARIKEAINAYGLTAQDLGLGRRERGRRAESGTERKLTVSRPTVGVPKYRDPQSGKTWTGRGKPPNWIAGVKDRAPFLIDGVTGEPGVSSMQGGAAVKRRRGGRKASADIRKGPKRSSALAAKGMGQTAAAGTEQ